MTLDFIKDEDSNKESISIILLTEDTLAKYLQHTEKQHKNWVDACGFKGKAEETCLIPSSDGKIDIILAGISKTPSVWAASFLPSKLPDGSYKFDLSYLDKDSPSAFELSLGWAMACYDFNQFKSEKKPQNKHLILDESIDSTSFKQQLISLFMVRDLINLPTNHMQAKHLAHAALEVAEEFSAEYEVIIGDELLKENYPAIHAVGRASDCPPRLVDIHWGDKNHPLVTLVGKGVCFDTGGLDIKPSSGMLIMKKDMGGAANILGLARMIMSHNLPIRLRVLIPAVENSVSSNAFRPLDIIETRKGLSVEVGNTDAEGRLILCDALAEADNEQPDLLIDCATLTGAARVALGTDIPAFFTSNEELANELTISSKSTKDAVWRLPLAEEYKEQLNTDNADISNISYAPFGGAITAALFLQRFVEQTKNWIHIDMMAWNQTSRSGRPKGGEAMAIRSLFEMLNKRYES